MASYFIADDGNDGTGAGTIENPWLTIQHALDSTTADATNPNQFNLKGTFTITAELDFTIQGTPSQFNCPTFRGYGTTENDGIKATIIRNGSFAIVNFGGIGSRWIDLVFDGNGIGSQLIYTNSNATYVRCKMFNCPTQYMNRFGTYAVIADCEMIASTSTGVGINASQDAVIINCYVEAPAIGLRLSGEGGSIRGNMIVISGASGNAIQALSAAKDMCQNSMVHTGTSTSSAIIAASSSIRGFGTAITNNLEAGFSAFVDYDNNAEASVVAKALTILNNSYYDSPGGIDMESYYYSEGNEQLGVSPFAGGTLDYDNRKTYFAPQDVGNVIGGGFADANLDRGALQSTPTGGAGNTIVIDQQRRY